MPSQPHDDRPDEQHDVLTRDREQVPEPRRPERRARVAAEAVVAPEHHTVRDGLAVTTGHVQRGARAAPDAVDQPPGTCPRADDVDRAGAQHLVHALPREPRALVEPVPRRPERRAQVTVDLEDLARLELGRDAQQDIGALEARDRALVPLTACDGTGDQGAAVHLPIDLRGERVLRQRAGARATRRCRARARARRTRHRWRRPLAGGRRPRPRPGRRTPFPRPRRAAPPAARARRRRQARPLRRRPHGATRPRSASSRAGPMPETSPRSSTVWNPPCAVRQATMRAASDWPMPSSPSSCSTVAELRCTIASARARGSGGGKRRRLAPSLRDSQHLAVGEAHGEVELAQVGPAERAARAPERIARATARRAGRARPGGAPHRPRTP